MFLRASVQSKTAATEEKEQRNSNLHHLMDLPLIEVNAGVILPRATLDSQYLSHSHSHSRTFFLRLPLQQCTLPKDQPPRGDPGPTMPQFDAVKAFLTAHALQWLTALIILLIGVFASRLSRRWLRSILDRSRVREDLLLKDFFLRSISLAIVILATLIALGHVGLDVTSLIAGLGITGLILGFGLRDTLSNFAAGLLLLIYRPFRAGELIEVEGAHGVVEELTIVNMQMTSTDGVRVIMPNSKVWGSKIVNYSLRHRRRLELTLKVRDDDVEIAISTINATLADDPRILKIPPPSVNVGSLTDSTATLNIWAWTSPSDFQSVTDDEYLRLLNSLNKAELQVI